MLKQYSTTRPPRAVPVTPPAPTTAPFSRNPFFPSNPSTKLRALEFESSYCPMADKGDGVGCFFTSVSSGSVLEMGRFLARQDGQQPSRSVTQPLV